MHNIEIKISQEELYSLLKHAATEMNECSMRISKYPASSEHSRQKIKDHQERYETLLELFNKHKDEEH